MSAFETFVQLLDLGGTFVFAISWALAAVNRRLDIFGILVLSSSASLRTLRRKSSKDGGTNCDITHSHIS